MQYASMFDKLVMDLSSRERKDLLEKIKGSSNVSIEPLVYDITEEKDVSLEHAYAKLGFLQKLLLLLTMFFTGKKREILVEEFVLKKLGERISKKNPSLISYSRKQLLEGFIREIESLQMHLTPLIAIFSKSLERRRGAFYAFLLSLELEDTNEKLVEETDPSSFYVEDRFRDISEVRGEMEHRFAGIIDSIKSEDRTRIYHSTLSLHNLYRLMTFRFDEIIPQDTKNLSGKKVLNFALVRKELMQLCDLLKSTTYPPPSEVLKAVYLFSLQDTAAEGPATETQIDEFISETDAALGIIRQFNLQVPLPDIIRCLGKNYSYKPHGLKGGEDWFVLFKAYWEQKIDERFKAFYREKKVKILLENALSFLESEFFPELTYYRQFEEEGRFVKFPLSVSFIRNFIDRIFIPRISKSLKTLLLNGNFYKKQNRSEFTDAFNNLTLLPDKINALDNDFSPDGEIGARIKQVDFEIKQNKLRHKQITSLSREIDDAAKRIIDESMASLLSLANVIDGVLYGQIGGKYDTISNLKNLGGKENAELIASLKVSIGTLNKAQEFVKDFYQVEMRTSGKERA